jgi:hypothetical protein
MQVFDPAVAAAVLAAELAEAYPSKIDAAMRDHFVAGIETVLGKAMRAEREACAALCGQRQVLWETAEAKPETPELMRTEARHRGNEAAYLADALRDRAEAGTRP